MKWFAILPLFFSLSVWAYPDLTRFQYNNCTACHVAPSGAGLLTSYGRSLSSEVLSTWGSESEAGFLHGALDRESMEKWLLVGGDIRGIQVHKETTIQKTARFIKMQMDLALGIVREKWALVTTMGKLENEKWTPVGTSYYAILKPLDEFSLRAGRFVPQYGLHLKDHILFARSFLGFGLNADRDVIEAQWTGEKWTSNITTAKQFNEEDPETAWTVQTQYFFGESSKIAANYWQGQAEAFRRELYGTWMVLGLTKKIFLINELDWQNKKNGQQTTRSFVTYNKLGYTLFKGFDGLLIGEFLKSDLSDTRTELNRYGIGFQFYPRPHFELTGAWTKQKSLALSGPEADYAWLLFHYYL